MATTDGYSAAQGRILGPDGGPARDRSPWPAWGRHTLSAAVGVALAAFAFQDVRRDATQAKEMSAALDQRVSVMEIRIATDSATAAERYINLLSQISSLIKTQDEQRSDVKEILRRLSK